MIPINHNLGVRTTPDAFSTAAYSVRAPLKPAHQNDSLTATLLPYSDAKPNSFGNNPGAADLVGMFNELFKQFFTQLQNLLQKDVRPSDSTNSPTPQPLVRPTADTTPADKQDELIPVLSNKRKGEKPNNIWNGFRQGRDGNCVTISAIKAAMAKFGQNPQGIYKSVEQIADGYRVVMRDGFELILSKSELSRAIRGSNFVPMNDPEMLKDAHFLFACSAKRAQMENNDGRARKSFEAAIRSLNDGEDERGSGEGLMRLGLSDHMKRVKVSAFADKSLIGMVNRRGHSVAVVDGAEELYGKKGGRPTDGHAIALV